MSKPDVEKVLKIRSSDKRVKKVKQLLLSVGKKIGSVYFVKKNGKVRKMCYRIGLTNKPKYAPSPVSKKVKKVVSRDSDHGLLTVFDVNKITYDKQGKITGRGAYRSVPLQTVFRMKVNGQVYLIA